MMWWSTLLFKISGTSGRKRLFKKWAKIGNTECLPLLLEATKSPNSSLQQTAIAALAHIPGPASMKALATLLKSDQVEIRVAVVTALGGMMDQAVVDMLIPCLADRSLEVQRSVLNALQKQGWTPRSDVEEAYQSVAYGRFKTAAYRGKAALEPLSAALRHELPSFRRDAAEAMEYIKDDRAIDPLLEAVRDPDITVRVAAVHSLGTLGGKRACLSLGILAKDPVQLVRLAVAESMRRNWQPGYMNSMTTMLVDSSFEVRITAVEALGHSGDPNTVSALIPLLKDADKDVRLAVVQALGNFKDSKALEPLTLTLLDPESVIRRAVEATLPLINSHWHTTPEAQRALPSIQKAMNADDYWVRQSAIRTSNLLTGMQVPSPFPTTHN